MNYKILFVLSKTYSYLTLSLIIKSFIMSHKAIAIRVKEEGKKSVRTSIDVEYGDAVAKYKMKEIGDLISSINPDAMVEVEFLIHNSISNTWMVMSSYYADEKRLVKH